MRCVYSYPEGCSTCGCRWDEPCRQPIPPDEALRLNEAYHAHRLDYRREHPDRARETLENSP